MVTLRPTIATRNKQTLRIKTQVPPQILNPPKNLFQLRYEYLTAPGSGSTRARSAPLPPTKSDCGWITE